jgi:serine/threonine protein kinase
MSDSRLPRGLELVRQLGSGAFGYVVQARDPVLRRDVAVKFVFGGAHAPDEIARLLREGRALNALHHPNVLQIYEAVTVADDLALVMEYAAGGDLENALRAGRLDVDQRLQVLDGVAAGLAAVHGVGIVHRDLKPANVLLGADGAPRLADFGLARMVRDVAAFRTATGGPAGTPGYAAPEQWESGETETPQMDWYAFAAMAQRVLTGRLPGPDAVVPFDEGLAADPAQRRSPQELMAAIRREPLARWSSATPPPAVPSDTADATGREATGRAPAAASYAVVETPPAVTASQDSAELPDQWVSAPVFHPTRVSRVRRLTPALGGLVLGLLAAAIILIAHFM